MRRYLLSFVFAICLFVSSAEVKHKEILIGDQMRFDLLDSTIKEQLRLGVTELVITLQPGVYTYNHKHIDLSALNYPDANITLRSRDALLVGKDLNRVRDWKDGSYSVIDLQDYDRWSQIESCHAAVEIVDADKKLCRLRTSSRQRPQTAEQCKNQYLQLTEWYDSKVYPIVRRDRWFIYFIAEDLKYDQQHGHWNVNADLWYGKVKPRYRTIAPTVPSSLIRYCQTSTFLNLWHTALGSFTLSGVNFGPNNGAEPLIATDMFRSRQLLIEDCLFRGIRGLVVKVWYTDNVSIVGNEFDGCYGNGVESFNGSRNTQVSGNTFANHGKGMNQNFGVICRGEDFLVARNRFCNFCYSAIGVGLWYGTKPNGPITGQVANNDISFDADYYEDYILHTLMDGGAIYTWTQCDGVTITGNRINRYRGMKDYRGIFCDDGGKNITLSGNTISNIGDNGWCIDLRWVDQVANEVPDHNTGNVMSGNKVDGKVRFETSRP